MFSHLGGSASAGMSVRFIIKLVFIRPEGWGQHDPEFAFVKDLRQTVKDSIKLSKLRTLVNRKVQALDSIGLQHTYLYLLLKNLNFNINWKNKTLAEMNVISERDVQMAKNLKWLLKNKYHGKKCIIWAANYHIANFSDNLTYTNYPETMMEV